MTVTGSHLPARAATHDRVVRMAAITAEVRQALRELGRDALAEVLSDAEIGRAVAAQERLLDRALASGYVDQVALGGVRVTADTSAADRDAFLALAVRDRLAFGRGWYGEELRPPWRAPDPFRGAWHPAWAAWLAALRRGEGTPAGWTTRDTLRWLATERERLSQPAAVPACSADRERLAWLGELLADTERQIAAADQYDRKRGTDAS